MITGGKSDANHSYVSGNWTRILDEWKLEEFLDKNLDERYY